MAADTHLLFFFIFFLRKSPTEVELNGTVVTFRLQAKCNKFRCAISHGQFTERKNTVPRPPPLLYKPRSRQEVLTALNPCACDVCVAPYGTAGQLFATHATVCHVCPYGSSSERRLTLCVNFKKKKKTVSCWHALRWKQVLAHTH